MSAVNSEIGVKSTMTEILGEYPGARRALFAKYHIGGCQTCAFQPGETLEALCERNEGLPPEEVLAHIEESHVGDAQILVSPLELADAMAGEAEVELFDVRTREEHEAVKIPGSKLLSQEELGRLCSAPSEHLVVVYDHLGKTALDATAYLIGHGVDGAKALVGGIDAYSREVDKSIQRYKLEMDA